MLLYLNIKNIALIEHVELEFEEGLNVLTGETGAGKSIIIDSIEAILGGRISKDIIRTGQDKAEIEAIFLIKDDEIKNILFDYGIEIESDGTLVISREFNTQGRNICRINGKLVTVSVLKEVGKYLIDIHGQHDNQSLLNVETHIELLDMFAGEKLDFMKKEYLTVLKEYNNVCERLEEIKHNEKEKELRIDILKYQIKEINEANLISGEEEKLLKKRMFLSNAEKILIALRNAYDYLYSGKNGVNSAYDLVNSANYEIESIVKYSPEFEAMVEEINDIYYRIEDISDRIRGELEKIEFNPDELELVEERLETINKLKKKYGSNIDEVLGYLTKVQNELRRIEMSDEIIRQLENEKKMLFEKLFDMASLISSVRLQTAQVLQEKICSELEELEMKNSKFYIDVNFTNVQNIEEQKNNIKFSNRGLDKVEFLISTNLGEPLKPLSKIASGGEMSRIMLAIKNILAKQDKIPTLIFDEIDTGISGIAAHKVGEKLSEVTKSHQVLCVTHLSQIACMADCHFFIEKKVYNNTTLTHVRKLSDDERKIEIARIIGGTESSEISLKHANEIILNAKKAKSSR